ncbi:type II toxin-antitoxin system VapC family toxin [Glycomyces tenuis]|uniref:type II toxin-antitoxin system VapC family toxin n=1 Tax=Glycomyces tenuis TaxID=58116 RepID=UPI00040C2208|nr:type II toxin-antitoxin system VapC family toxin [Glycomyces tenuis]
MRFHYLDSSAAMKLFLDEECSEDLEEWLARRVEDRQITSKLTRTEVRRGLHAAGAQADARAQALHWLERTAVVALPTEVFDAAGDLQAGSPLRSLDAIHVAVAGGLGEALGYFLTYDKRQAAAAEAEGMKVASPGLTG